MAKKKEAEERKKKPIGILLRELDKEQAAKQKNRETQREAQLKIAAAAEKAKNLEELVAAFGGWKYMQTSIVSAFKTLAKK